MKIIALVLTLSFLTACATSGRQISQQSVDGIVIGESTSTELIASFGAPLSQSYNSEGKLILIWFYVHAGAFGSGMEQQNLTVLFDNGGAVEKFNMINGINNGVRLGY